MRWDDFRRSENVEDDRGGGGFSGGGGGIGLPGGGLGIGTIIILGLVGWALGIDPRLLIGGAEILQGGQQQYQQPAQPRASRNTPPNDQMGQFVAAVLATLRIPGTRYSPKAARHIVSSNTMNEVDDNIRADEAWTLLRTLFGQQRRRFLDRCLRARSASGPGRSAVAAGDAVADERARIAARVRQLQRHRAHRPARGQETWWRDSLSSNYRRVKHVVLTDAGRELRARLLDRVGQPPAGFDVKCRGSTVSN